MMLQADCTQCAALCCLGLAFDRSDMFAIDKAAGVACPKLGSDHKCRIHDDLTGRGFAGCVQYDCMGAGQRVTQELFDGRSWRDDKSLVPPMMEAFRVMRQVHELALLLQTAGQLPLPTVQAERCRRLQNMLQPTKGWNLETLAVFESGEVPDEIKRFLSGLKDYVVRG